MMQKKNNNIVSFPSIVLFAEGQSRSSKYSGIRVINPIYNV